MILRQSIGTSFRFIGFGGQATCSNCRNVIIEGYYIQQISHSVTFMPTSKSLYKVYKICATCEHQTEFGRLTGLFGSGNKRSELAKELESGKTYTNSVYKKMPDSEKNEYLKLLNKLEQQSLVLYLGNQ